MVFGCQGDFSAKNLSGVSGYKFGFSAKNLSLSVKEVFCGNLHKERNCSKKPLNL